MFAWQETKTGLVIIILFDLFLTYVFVALAIDTGSLLQWFVALMFLALTIGQSVKLIKKVMSRG
ncbi:MAG TPA: hypothetical protein VK978_02570 [Candidatus Saccharimonadales bacterium]|nr:hypothetical protein [Candidatus Saccharimonadales bacterium]